MYEIVKGQTLSGALADFINRLCQQILAADPAAFTNLDPAAVRASLTASLAGHDRPLLPENVTESGPSLQSLRFSSHNLTADDFVLGSRKFAPWPHQLLTIRSIVFQIINGQKQFLLADSVGGGKTAQALGVFFELKKLSLLNAVVIYAPKATIPDWQQTLALFTGDEAIVVNDIADFSALSENPTIVIVRQNMRVADDDAEALKGILKNALLIADESPNLSGSLKHTISDDVVRLNLSGTAVTNTFHDIVPFTREKFTEEQAEQAASNLSEVFASRLAVAAFRSKVDAGQGFLAYLNLLSSMMDSTFMRTRAALALNIPDFTVNFHALEEVRDDFAIRQKKHLSQLMTKGGVSVALNAAGRKEFNRAAKLNEGLIAYAEAALKKAPKGSGILFVCVRSGDVDSFRKTLQERAKEHRIYKIANKSERKKIIAHSTDNAVAVISAAKDVEGFNIQKQFANGLLRVVFLGGVKNASDFEQGVGRAVRPLSQPLACKVRVDIVVKDTKSLEVVDKIVYGTIKAKLLLSLALLAPSQAFLSVAKATMDRGIESGLRFVTSEQELFVEIDSAILGVQKKLDEEFALSTEEIKDKMLLGNLVAQLHPFVLSNLKRFNFSASADKRFAWFEQVMNQYQFMPTKYVEALQMMSLFELLEKPVLKLSHQLGIFSNYIVSLDRALEFFYADSYLARQRHHSLQALLSVLKGYLRQPSFKFALNADIGKYHERVQVIQEKLHTYQQQLQQELDRQAQEKRQRHAEQMRRLQEQQHLMTQAQVVYQTSDRQAQVAPPQPVQAGLAASASLHPFAGLELKNLSDPFDSLFGVDLSACYNQESELPQLNADSVAEILPAPLGSTAAMVNQLAAAGANQPKSCRRNYVAAHAEDEFNPAKRVANDPKDNCNNNDEDELHAQDGRFSFSFN